MAPLAVNASEFDLMMRERVGGLRIDATEDEVVNALGAPPKRSRPVEAGADGQFYETWSYRSIGVELEMCGPKAKSRKRLASIELKSPSMLKTSRGIGIGSTFAELTKAYGRDRNAEESHGDLFVVGSVYGGVMFTIKRGRVESVFVGAAAD